MADKRKVVMTKDDIVDAVGLWFAQRHPTLYGDLSVDLEVSPRDKDITFTIHFTPKAT